MRAASLYWEGFENKIYFFFGVKGVSAPIAVSVFPDELYPALRSWAEQAYPKPIHYSKLQGRTLCGLGAAEALRGRNPRQVPVVAPLMKWKWRPVEIICDFTNFEIAQGRYFSAAVVAVGLSTA